MFTDDIDQIELLLAHAIPEGIANTIIPAVIIILMFIINWRLGLLALVPLVIGLFAMGMMMKSGMEKILVISDGRIIESGDHAQLMEQNGMYAHMVGLQAKGA